jgi:hypothetical protein
MSTLCLYYIIQILDTRFGRASLLRRQGTTPVPLTVRRLRDVSKEGVDITHDCPIIVQGLFCGCLGGIQNDVGENQICLNFSAALVRVAVQLREGRRRNSWDDRKVSSSTAARHRSPAYSQGHRFDETDVSTVSPGPTAGLPVRRNSTTRSSRQACFGLPIPVCTKRLPFSRWSTPPNV